MSSSDDCKVNCIDVGKNFCPSSGHKSGVCCDSSNSNCPKTDICSSEAGTVRLLKNWACPNEAFCGSEVFLSPNRDGSNKFIAFDSSAKGSSTFIQNKTCKYLLQFPAGAGMNDQITIVANGISDAYATIMTGILYSNQVARMNVVPGRTYTINFPDRGFLLIESAQSSQSGYFSFRLNYVDKEGPALD